VDPSFLVFLVPVLPAIGAGLAWWWHPTHRARRQLARSEEKSLANVVQGNHVRVLGIARRASGSLNAPFSGRRCVAFRAVAEQYQDNDWMEVFRVEDSVPFVLVAEGIEAHVCGPLRLGLEIDDRGGELSGEALETLAKHGVASTAAQGGPRQLRWHEATLEDGDPIWVLGRARLVVDPRGQRESLRGPPMLRIFEGTERQPIVLADEWGPGAPEQLCR
jgi:hypothetical protein